MIGPGWASPVATFTALSAAMTETWGTRQQPSDPEPEPGLRPEHGYLLGAAVFLTIALCAFGLDERTTIEVNRGAYAILVSLFIAGLAGWLVRSAQRQVFDETTRLRAEVAALRREMPDGPRVAEVAPPWGQAVGGHTYLSRSAMETTVPAAPSIDPDTVAAVGRLHLRLIGGQSDQR
jgi:hypothetical protein